MQLVTVSKIVEAENNLAQELLLYGNWKEGLPLYENRISKLKANFYIYEKLYGKPWEGLATRESLMN